jgi:hypothetical protein
MTVADALARLEVAAREAPTEDVPGLLGELEKIKAVLWGRLAVPKRENGGADRLLTIDQTAERLGVPEGWLKKRPDLPFRVVLSEGTVRYSAEGIAAYIRSRSRAG